MTPDDVIPLHLADVTYPASHPLAGQDGPVLAFAIRHPDGIVLVDTGIGEGNEWIETNYQPRARKIREALNGAGLDADGVRVIVNSHLHFDHCGQNRAFPGVPIHVQKTELDLALREGHTIVEWVDFPDAHYQAVEGDAELQRVLDEVQRRELDPLSAVEEIMSKVFKLGDGNRPDSR